MEKLDGTSMNLIQENIKKLKEIFPEIFSRNIYRRKNRL